MQTRHRMCKTIDRPQGNFSGGGDHLLALFDGHREDKGSSHPDEARQSLPALPFSKS